MSDFAIFRKAVTVTRRSAVDYVDGEAVAQTTSTFDIQASVQPATGQQLQLLPEGRRQGGTYVLRTDTELRTVEPAQHQADLVTINGKTYEVLIVNDWQNGIIPHYEVTVARVESA